MITEHLPIREVAERLHVHPETIRRRIKRGELEAVRLGPTGPIRVSVDELSELLRPTSSVRPTQHAQVADLGPDHAEPDRALNADHNQEDDA